MLRRLERRALTRLGPRYPRAVLAAQYGLSFLVVGASVLLLRLFTEVSDAALVRILVVAGVLEAIELGAVLSLTFRLLRPADPWLQGDHSPEAALPAWGAIAGLPLDVIRFGRGLPVLLSVIPISVYVTLELDTPFFPAFLAILAGAFVVLAYVTFLRFFMTELALRPVLAEVSRDLPDGADLRRATAPLGWRLIVTLPVINVITGVVVVGLAAPDASLKTLGLGVVVALAVSFTISLGLSVLLLRSILEPIQDLQRGTDRVSAGDLSVRVPVLGTDETGRLAGSFNEMLAGLQERARLREAFGAFVDPGLADRVLAEGTVLEGEEADVTVLFVDIRDFTAFAERAPARDVVAQLNDFYEQVVPVLVGHGGHANKFVGDGLLAVFGAPERLRDHADRGVAAALEITEVVQRAFAGRLEIGVGVNSGPVVAGTIGGGGRVEFGVIGDTVNTAARVEAVTRETGDVVLVTDATLRRLRRDHGGFEPRGSVQLRGRSAGVRLHAPLAAVRPERPALRIVEAGGADDA